MDATSALLQTAIAGAAAALAADSVNPQPTISLDGKMVSNAEWREKLTANIKQWQDAINQRNPTITWTGGGCRGFPWSGG